MPRDTWHDVAARQGPAAYGTFTRSRHLRPFEDWTVAASHRFTLLDLGLGGCSLEARGPLAVGETHSFALSPPGGRTVTLRGVVRYCERLTSHSSNDRYMIGVEFVCAEIEQAEALAQLVELSTAMFTSGAYDDGVE